MRISNKKCRTWSKRIDVISGKNLLFGGMHNCGKRKENLGSPTEVCKGNREERTKQQFKEVRVYGCQQKSQRKIRGTKRKQTKIKEIEISQKFFFLTEAISETEIRKVHWNKKRCLPKAK